MFELVSDNTWYIAGACLIFIAVLLLSRLWIWWGQRMDSVTGEKLFCVDCTHHVLQDGNSYFHRCDEPRAPKHLVKGDCSEAFCTTLRGEGRATIVFGEDGQPKEMYKGREICGASGSWFVANKDSE